MSLAERHDRRHLVEEHAVASVGSKGDSYDNALAETVNGLYKTELIRRSGPWRTVDHLEIETAKWVDWWNNRRLHTACGDLPPAEYEANYYRSLKRPDRSFKSKRESLYRTQGGSFHRSWDNCG